MPWPHGHVSASVHSHGQWGAATAPALTRRAARARRGRAGRARAAAEPLESYSPPETARPARLSAGFRAGFERAAAR